MISVGETLRRERLRRNLDLEQVSGELKISPRFLAAIEDERFDQLPARVFAKSFVRQYARFLDLDEEELSAEVQRAVQPERAPTAPAATAAVAADMHLPRLDRWQGGVATRRPFSWTSSLPALAGVVVVMLVCSAVYSLWQRSRMPSSPRAQIQPGVAEVRPPVPPSSLQPAPTPGTPPATQPAGPEPAPSQTGRTPAREAARPATSGSPAVAPAENGADRNAADRPAETAAPPATNPANGLNTGAPLRVEVTAEEPVWVLAQNNGKYLFSGTLDPNQTRTVEGAGTVTLRLGNAGGVNITFNGKPIGPVGPRGQVRTVQFTSGGFHVVSAPKVSLDDML